MSWEHSSRQGRDIRTRAGGTAHAQALTMKIENRIATVTLGLGLPLLSFASLHLLHPPGQPEHMTDPEIARWAEAGAHEFWLGGSLSLLTVFLLLAWGWVAAARLDAWRSPAMLRAMASHAVVVVAAVVALASIVQVTAAVIATPGEHVGSATLLPVLTLLGGNVNVASWCLLAPVGVAVASAPLAPLWLRIVSGMLGALLALSVALPFVSWFLGFALVLVVTIPAGEAHPARSLASPRNTAVAHAE
jgi:hypothetical protein